MPDKIKPEERAYVGFTIGILSWAVSGVGVFLTTRILHLTELGEFIAMGVMALSILLSSIIFAVKR